MINFTCNKANNKINSNIKKQQKKNTVINFKCNKANNRIIKNTKFTWEVIDNAKSK